MKGCRIRNCWTVIGLVVVAAILVGRPATVRADESLRCGSKLISVNDGKDKVRTLCGEPTSVSFEGVIRRAPRYQYGYGLSRYEYSGPGVVEMPVELWTYNFGTSKLLRKLRFVGDALEEIRTDGYGY